MSDLASIGHIKVLPIWYDMLGIDSRVVEVVQHSPPPLKFAADCGGSSKISESTLQLVSPRRFAKMSGVSQTTVLRAVRDGQLPTLKIGKRSRIDLTTVNDRLRAGTPSAPQA